MSFVGTMASKQVILVRTDLKMPKGKIGAQVAHASLGAILPIMKYVAQHNNTWVSTNNSKKSLDLVDWLNFAFTKVCLAVGGLEELKKFEEEAKRAGIATCLITDSGRTIFNGIPTITTCAIGPASEEEINKITGKLKLL